MVNGSSNSTRRCIEILLLGFVGLGSAMFHKLDIKNDQRSLFKIETFCFEEGGNMDIDVSEFVVHSRATGDQVHGVRAGFLMVKTSSESQLQQLLEESIEDKACILDGSIFSGDSSAVVMDMSAEEELHNGDLVEGGLEATRHRSIKQGGEGLYSLVFARCAQSEEEREKYPQPSKAALDLVVDFKLSAAFWNKGPNYLSACEAALPKLYLAFAALFVGASVAWARVLVGAGSNQVHDVHKLMLVLVVFKAFALLLDSIRYHFLAATGSADGWSAVYYVLTFCKSLLLFTVIILIGTGWSLVKPFLNDKEKQVMCFVGVLQVFDNIALVVLEEMSPGSQEWYTWRDVLHLVDIACCCAILFPIVWSIRSLRQAATADGKAEHNLLKLTLFRQFYIMVVAYIYFTRIVVFLLAATMPYDMMWLRFAFTEAAAFALFTTTGFKFKPDTENPYLPVKREDDENDSEFGLSEGGEAGVEEYRTKS